MNPATRPLRRLVLTALTAVALVVTTAFAMPSIGGRSGDMLRRYDATKKVAVAAHLEALPHDHNNPATKNLLSRAGETGTSTQDPTTAAQKRAHASYVARERQMRDPQLTTVPLHQRRRVHPQGRYAIANGCYRLTRGSEPLYYKPTKLGSYLLYDHGRRFLDASGGGSDRSKADSASGSTVWTARMRGTRMTFRHGHTVLRHGKTTRFLMTRTRGCTHYPESQVDVSGRPFAGVTPYQEVRGYLDAHTHGQAWEFLGGSAHCGRPWHRFGVDHALVDCPDHQTGTNPLEAFLSGRPTHDPVGWPTFKDWPAPDSLTHEGTYYKWIERSWRGGQRLFVNLLVENNQLCMIYPLHRNAKYAKCKDMPSLHRQARDMYQMQNYIDAQWGGPGKGWYRIVKNPFQARRVINEGKLAVVMGIETSVPFGCTFKAGPQGDTPAGVCTPRHIQRQLDTVRRWGVRQMELVNKFDNALAGVAGDNGSTGAVVNQANFKETGTYWDMQHCDDAETGVHDKDQYAAPDFNSEQQDAFFGAIEQLYGTANTAPPVYPPPHHCNSRGLTTLGEDTIRGLARRHMIFDPDHMSVAARQSSLDQLEQMHYPGVVSSHSWSTVDAYPRIYRLGGFIAPYAGDSTGFVDKWRAHLGWADPRYYFGFGYGADINGLGAQGDPRGAGVPNPVTYPFTGMGGVTVRKQHAGKRVYDINKDGVAQYGLYPDWLQDLRKIADASAQHDGGAIFEDMSRGPEAYLQMWERAEGIAADSCRNPELRKPVSRVRDLIHAGMTTRQVMERVGQPYTRLGRTFGFCATRPGDANVRVTVRFTPSGRVLGLRA